MKKMKRLFSLMMVVIMMLSMTLNVSADTTTVTGEEATYVLNYNGQYTGPKWQYFSPYMPSWTYDDSFDYNNTISFSLYDTKNGDVFPVWCTDIDTGLDNNSNFRRLNLEDSTYASSSAGLLRSIMLKGFPNVGVEDLSAATGVENLTIGEVVTAMQTAIWQAAHGERVEFTDFVYSFDTQWSSEGVTAHYTDCYAEIANGYANAENEDLIESHIEAVFNYLINLKPTPPQSVSVSNSSFVSWSDAPVLSKNDDGTYNVTVSAIVDVEMEDTDDLTLSATIGTYSVKTALSNGTNDKSLTITNVPADVVNGDVKLAIDGNQTAADVFLFDAVGERGTSLLVYLTISFRFMQK